MRSIGLGTLVGLIVAVTLSIMYLGIGQLVGALLGGFIAGLIARGIIGGTIAGILTGIANAVILAILALAGFAWYGCINYGFLGAFLAGIVGTALSLLISVFATVLSAISGFFGGLLRRH